MSYMDYRQTDCFKGATVCHDDFVILGQFFAKIITYAQNVPDKL